jgi:hypothetical protein
VLHLWSTALGCLLAAGTKMLEQLYGELTLGETIRPYWVLVTL